MIPGKYSIPVIMKIIKRKRDNQGNPIVKEDAKPTLDLRVYKFEFTYGQVGEYSGNTVIKSIIEQVEKPGWGFRLLDKIVYVCFNKYAITQVEDAFININVVQNPIITTKVWYLQAKWKDASKYWLPCNVINESNPVEVDEYAEPHGLRSNPDFKLWVKRGIRHRDRIIKKVKYRCRKSNHIMFGVKSPLITE